MALHAVRAMPGDRSTRLALRIEKISDERLQEIVGGIAW